MNAKRVTCRRRSVVGALVVAFAAQPLLAGCIGERSPPSGSVMSNTGTSPLRAERPLSVVASVQDARGRSQRDITPEFARELEAASATEIRQKTLAILKEHKLPLVEPAIKSESSVLRQGSRRLAYIAMELDGRSRAVEVVGIEGNRMQRVFCFRDSLDDIALSEGACGDKLAEVFKVRVKAASTRVAAR